MSHPARCGTLRIEDMKEKIAPLVLTNNGYLLNVRPKIGKTYYVECAKCNNHVDIKPSKKEVETVFCSECGAKISFVGIDGGTIGLEPTRENNNRARLEWGSWFRKKTYTFREGENTIGRKHPDVKTDVQLKDPYASTESVVIKVTKKDNGYNYDLVVKNATNPVLLNGREKPIGSITPLTDGDTIKLGNTTLRFKI